MGYLSIKQTSEKWNISVRWINDLCKVGHILEKQKADCTGRFQRMQKSLLMRE